MQPPPLQLSGLVLTCLIFGTLGYLTGKRVKKPLPVWAAVLLMLVTAFAGHIGVSTRLISIFGLTLYINWVLQTFGLGVIFNVLLRNKIVAPPESTES